ncbi:MAG TPA: GNAT family N-acetyltransferase [Gemmataceae bacterium]|nr:GNAT family N-acetyltransferase [Gemmataceae bacterium]
MADEVAIARPVPLDQQHDLTAFDCGSSALNDYLAKYAWASHRGQAARTYVAARGNRVAGYYTLTAGSVRRDDTPLRVAKGLGNYPVPIILLARLAVDRSEQGKGLGAALLKDAILRAAQAAEIVGCRALLVHAKDQAARTFYRKFGFESSPVNELHLYLLMKDILANQAGTAETATQG